MRTSIPFFSHAHLQRLLGTTAQFWGLRPQQPHLRHPPYRTPAAG